MRHRSTSHRPTRRRFLSLAAGATGFLALSSSRSAFTYAANERLNLAIVGVAGYAAAAAFVPAIHIYDNVGITALCDVDQRKAMPQLEIWKQRAAAWPTSTKDDERKAAPHYQRLAEKTPPMFDDFRQMLSKMGREFDAVVVSTPDHSHAVIAATCLRAGKHVLAEKPLTIRVHEARALRTIASQSKLATSVGTQGMQSHAFRRGVELIREGAIGPVEQVHIWFARGGRNHKAAPKGPEPIPKELNWDLWLGPVAWREYHPNWISRNSWRDTGIGELGNFGPHSTNLAFMALNVADLWQAPPAGAPAPRIVFDAECSELNRLSFPVWERIRWQVPARGAMPPVTFTWHHGPDYAPGSRELLTKLLRDHGATDEQLKNLLKYAGAAIVGSKGILVTDSHNVSITLLPQEKFKDVAIDRPKTLKPSLGHYKDWISACRGGDAPWGRFEYAATFSEMLNLGSIATQVPGTALSYDPIAGKIINNDPASALLSYEYRKGFEL